MGSRLVTDALAWSGLRTLQREPISDRAYRLLIHMAHTAHDSDSDRVRAGRYFARWEASAAALGVAVPDDATDPESQRLRRNAYKRVKEVRLELARSGAIRPVGNARPGRTAEYVIELSDVDNSRKGHREGAPLGTERVPHFADFGTERVPKGAL